MGVEADPEGRVDVDDELIAMFVLKAGEELRILTANDDSPEPEPGDELIGLPPGP